MTGEFSNQAEGEGASSTRGPEEDRGHARFNGLLGEYNPRLIRFLEIRTGSRADAQDLAQEAYFRLCRVKSPDLIREPEAYLFRIATNLANELMLSKRKQPTSYAKDIADADVNEGDDGSFCTHIEKRSEIERLGEILSELPPLYQAILLLRKRDGFSHKEIAERLGVSPHTVQKYLTRALLACRKTWEERYED